MTIIYLAIAGTGVLFIFLDFTEIGVINYRNTQSNRQFQNKFTCTLTSDYLKLHCVNGRDICTMYGNYTESISILRSDINSNYDSMQILIYFISKCIACSVAYILLTLLWILWPDAEDTHCGLKMKHKCVILCCLSMIASMIAILFGIISLNESQKCSHGLEQFVESKVTAFKPEYEWMNDTIDTKQHSTAIMIFMIITCVISCLCTFLCLQCSIKSSNKHQRALTDFGEGIIKSYRKSLIYTQYGSAEPADYTLNEHEEGIFYSNRKS